MPVNFTNKHNLPESFVNAVLQDDHVVAGDISVTQLIDAPQIRQLKKIHTYEQDVMDMIIMALGTGMHTILERGDMKGSAQARKLQIAAGVLLELGEEKAANYLKKLIVEKLQESIDSDVITERTLTIDVLGWRVSGTFDRYTKSIEFLEDYKTGSANASMVPETKKSWNSQLNVYAVMLRENGLPVKGARIIAILKDWSKMRVNVSRDYPRTPVIMHDIPLLEHDRVMAYIESRVKLHQRAEAGEHIPCTPKDRWAKPDSWAVKKTGGKKALKLFDHPDATTPWIEQNKHKFAEGELFVEHRKGESFRCANGYCPVSDFCPQYAEEKRLAAEAANEM